MTSLRPFDYKDIAGKWEELSRTEKAKQLWIHTTLWYTTGMQDVHLITNQFDKVWLWAVLPALAVGANELKSIPNIGKIVLGFGVGLVAVVILCGIWWGRKKRRNKMYGHTQNWAYDSIPYFVDLREQVSVLQGKLDALIEQTQENKEVQKK